VNGIQPVIPGFNMKRFRNSFAFEFDGFLNGSEGILQVIINMTNTVISKAEN
jgi:hypothetical protein